MYLPLSPAISEEHVAAGRRQPVTEVAFLFAELGTTDGHAGLGFSYATRAGGPGLYAHAKEIVPLLLGEDPNDVGRVREKLVAAGASAGRTGLAAQAIGAVDVGLWDLKAKRANLSLAKLLGSHRDAVSCYTTSGGSLSVPADKVVENARRSLAQGAGGIGIAVGAQEVSHDVERMRAVREALGDDVPLIACADQQWNRVQAGRHARRLDEFSVQWLADPLDAHDTKGHAALAATLTTPIATGATLTSVDEHWRLMTADAAAVLQPDVAAIGGITPFLRVAALADQHHLTLAPHFATELHVHLAAAYPGGAWVEHVDWLAPLFNEKLAVENGAVAVPDQPGIGLSLSERSRMWTTDRIEFAESV
ncbi:mandelate racemase/muconate lactonizing enzyme family protein [Actinophytocola glycyrrhizae]|uniref:Mandelate racemase/muconate lactonizing enzyme family protein n=1 Tax=Actinophytocola glycyrrhizae TaxID=2044873 RepID=A0ABV9SBA9_9PSEU